MLLLVGISAYKARVYLRPAPYAEVRILMRGYPVTFVVMIRIGIAEDIPQIAQALTAKIRLSQDFEVVFVASNGRLAIDELRHGARVDVVLMDIHMPDMNGIDAVAEVTARWPQVKVIMCTVFDDDEHILHSIMAGAGGYLLKDESPQHIHRAIFSIMEGGAPMSQGIASRVLKLLRGSTTHGKATGQVPDFGLTDREKEVLVHLSRGLSYEQIADNLIISYGTVRKHVENIYRKLQVNNRTDALRKAEGR